MSRVSSETRTAPDNIDMTDYQAAARGLRRCAMDIGEAAALIRCGGAVPMAELDRITTALREDQTWLNAQADRILVNGVEVAA